MRASDLDQGNAATAGAVGAVPIEGYDEMRVADILPVLMTLDEPELRAVERRERQGKNRAMVLNRIARLRARRGTPVRANDPLSQALGSPADRAYAISREPALSEADGNPLAEIDGPSESAAGPSGSAGIESPDVGDPGEWFDDPGGSVLLACLGNTTQTGGTPGSLGAPLSNRRPAQSTRSGRVGLRLVIATGVVVVALTIAGVGAFALGHSKPDPSANYLAAARKAASGTLLKSSPNAYLLALGQAVCTKLNSTEAPAQVAANMLVPQVNAAQIIVAASRYLCPADHASVTAWSTGAEPAQSGLVTTALKPAARKPAAPATTAHASQATTVAGPDAAPLPPPVIANGIQFTMTKVSSANGGLVITVDVKNVSAPGVALNTSGPVQMACGAGGATLEFTGGGPGASSAGTCPYTSIAVGTETAVPMTFPAFRLQQLPLGSTLYMTLSVGTRSVTVNFPVPTSVITLPPKTTTADVQNNAQPPQGPMADAIAYVVTSTGGPVQIFYTRDGESEQALQPFIGSMNVITAAVVPAGTYMWVNARNLGDAGNVTCQIYANGSLEDSNTASGPGALASCAWNVDS